MRRVDGVVQHYAWGDVDALPRLLGVEPDGRPWAEVWYGTHPMGHARHNDAPLADLAGDLPFMVKFLAAAEPLSLQTHPDEDQARRGFAAEDAAGLPRDHPRRIYRDPHAKPEMVVALSPFAALCGFAPVATTIATLRALGADGLADHLDGDGLAATTAALYEGRLPTAPVVEACRERHSPAARVCVELDARRPGDPSAVVSLLLNHVVLEPGEALYLPAGNLHAYLRGVAVEVLGASDNVVRGGLTDKHVDLSELLRILRFDEVADPVVHDVGGRYATPGAPFEVTAHRLGGSYVAPSRTLLVVVEGSGPRVRLGEVIYLDRGERIDLTGHGTFLAVSEPT